MVEQIHWHYIHTFLVDHSRNPLITDVIQTEINFCVYNIYRPGTSLLPVQWFGNSRVKTREFDSLNIALTREWNQHDRYYEVSSASNFNAGVCLLVFADVNRENVYEQIWKWHLVYIHIQQMRHWYHHTWQHLTCCSTHLWASISVYYFIFFCFMLPTKL